MKIWMFFGLALLVQAHGTVLVQSEQSRNLDYLATLKAHPEYTSPAQEYLNQHPSMSQREKLIQLFSAAQKAFLESSTDIAKQKFGELLQLLWADDWNKTEREIFLTAYLRLAQLETDSSSKDHWLGQSLSLGEDLNYDRSLYPPPLLKRRNELMAVTPKIAFPLTSLPTGWSEFLINSQHCERWACADLKFYPGKVRVTFLSNQWAPQTAIIDLAEIKNFQPTANPLVEGECSHPDWSQGSASFSDKKAFWSLDCDRPQNLKAINFQPTVPSPGVLPLNTEHHKSRPFYKSPWLWASAGALVAILIAVNSRSKESKQPTTTYGY